MPSKNRALVGTVDEFRRWLLRYVIICFNKAGRSLVQIPISSNLK